MKLKNNMVRGHFTKIKFCDVLLSEVCKYVIIGK